MKWTLVLVMMSRFCFAQNYLEDIKKMQSVYSEDKSFRVETAYNLMTGSGEPISFVSGFLIFDQGNYEMKMGPMHVITGRDYNLVIDDEKKKMVLTSVLSKSALINQMMMGGMDSTVLEKAIITFSKIGKGIGKYDVIFNSGGKISKSTLSFNLKSFEIVEMTMDKIGANGRKQVLEIKYSNFTNILTTDNKRFHISNFVTKVANKNLGVGKYQDYSIQSNYIFK